jgi:hypothetical protein
LKENAIGKLRVVGCVAASNNFPFVGNSEGNFSSGRKLSKDKFLEATGNVSCFVEKYIQPKNELK